MVPYGVPGFHVSAVESTTRTSMENIPDVSFGSYLPPNNHELVNSRGSGGTLV